MTDTILLGIPLLLSGIDPAVKGPFKVYKKKCKSELYSALDYPLDDYPQRVNVFNARRSRSEACLLTIYGGIKMVFYPIQYVLGDDLGDCRQDTDFLPIIAKLLKFFWDFFLFTN